MNDSDDISPDDRFPVVGIGASAGGLEAAGAFFDRLPAQPGMAFVLVMHLSREHESHLSGLLSSHTEMKVESLEEPTPIEVDHVYVIAPGTRLTVEDGRLVPDREESGRRNVVDRFLRSLADCYLERAIAVILSGSGTDGAQGAREVNSRNGLVLAQKPSEAKFGSMPRAVRATGCVDAVLGVEEIADRLMDLRRNGRLARLPSDTDDLPDGESQAFRKILVRVEDATGHNFAEYKPPTLLRRIGRRMHMVGLESHEAYLSYLRENPNELQVLYRDLLIRVTSFFRDREAFDYLREEVVPELFRGKTSSDQLRVWIPACATGEEAYAIAILLTEHAHRVEDAPALQFFATDVDERSIQTARSGSYVESIAQDVPDELLTRYFHHEDDQYRVTSELRDRIVFATHDVLTDPPFSGLDLVSCRNLLIYLSPEAQNDLLEIFHFALDPGGYLLLGVSESTDSGSSLYTTLNKSNSIYQRRKGSSTPLRFNRWLGNQTAYPPAERRSGPSGSAEPKTEGIARLHREILCSVYAPPSVLVDGEYRVLHVSEGGSRYLQFPEGEPPHTLLEMVPESIRPQLRTALFTAVQDEEIARRNRIRTNIQGRERLISFTVTTIAQAEDVYQIVFEEETETPPVRDADEPESDADDSTIRQLEAELEQTRERLRATMEQYETTNEELRASNEELLSMNEELQSTTEELETSKEELESMNEELTTVNDELNTKVSELVEANADLKNLMAATEIPTLFLDRDLRIRRYTPRTEDLFNLIESDEGRFIGHLNSSLEYESLVEDARAVMDQNTVVEREVHNEDERWYVLRLRPYRTAENQVRGVVLSFFDITERKRAEVELETVNRELEERVEKRTAALQHEIAQRDRLEREVLRVSEEERWRLGESLHDDLGQRLSGIRMLCRTLVDRLRESDPAAAEKASEIEAQIEEANQRARDLAHGITPVELDEKGLATALERLCEETEELYGVTCESHVEVDLTIPEWDRGSQLYRIVQEAINNAVTHGEADRIWIEISTGRESELTVQIHDDGKGLSGDPSEVRNHGMGIRLMEYRAHVLGGTLEVKNRDADGTTVTCSVPRTSEAG